MILNYFIISILKIIFKNKKIYFNIYIYIFKKKKKKLRTKSSPKISLMFIAKEKIKLSRPNFTVLSCPIQKAPKTKQIYRSWTDQKLLSSPDIIDILIFEDMRCDCHSYFFHTLFPVTLTTFPSPLSHYSTAPWPPPPPPPPPTSSP